MADYPTYVPWDDPYAEDQSDPYSEWQPIGPFAAPEYQPQDGGDAGTGQDIQADGPGLDTMQVPDYNQPNPGWQPSIWDQATGVLSNNVTQQVGQLNELARRNVPGYAGLGDAVGDLGENTGFRAPEFKPMSQTADDAEQSWRDFMAMFPDTSKEAPPNDLVPPVPAPTPGPMPTPMPLPGPAFTQPAPTVVPVPDPTPTPSPIATPVPRSQQSNIDLGKLVRDGLVDAVGDPAATRGRALLNVGNPVVSNLPNTALGGFLGSMDIKDGATVRLAENGNVIVFENMKGPMGEFIKGLNGGKPAAMTIGHVIMNTGTFDMNDPESRWLYEHELAHVAQSDLLGNAYLPAYGLSWISAMLQDRENPHDKSAMEWLANDRADRLVPGGRKHP